MSRRHLLRVARGALALTVVLAGCRFSGFNDPASRTTASKATTWLLGRQQADGGFEVAGFPGFETPDATLAIAENAQTAATWSTTEAKNAVSATVRNGRTPLTALGVLAAGSIDAGQAAKLIVLDVEPLGLNPKSFRSVNLVKILDSSAQADGSYGTFNDTLFAAIADRLVAGSVPAKTLTLIRNAEQANGGWTFTGSPSGSDLDIDTTGLAVQALAAANVSPTDASLAKGLAFLAAQHQASGAWQSFGSDDPNSTSLAVLGITAAGFDPTSSCWRNRVAPGLAGTPYASPIPWLRGRQAADGHITSPNDSFPPVNTFATSQTIEALRREWIPVTPLNQAPC